MCLPNIAKSSIYLISILLHFESLSECITHVRCCSVSGTYLVFVYFPLCAHISQKIQQLTWIWCQILSFCWYSGLILIETDRNSLSFSLLASKFLLLSPKKFGKIHSLPHFLSFFFRIIRNKMHLNRGHFLYTLRLTSLSPLAFFELLCWWISLPLLPLKPTYQMECLVFWSSLGSSMCWSLSNILGSLYVSLTWSLSSSLVYSNVTLLLSVKISFANLKGSLANSCLAFFFSFFFFCSTFYPSPKYLNTFFYTSSCMSFIFPFPLHLLLSTYLLAAFFLPYTIFFLLPSRDVVFPVFFFLLVVSFSSESSAAVAVDCFSKSSKILLNCSLILSTNCTSMSNLSHCFMS